MARVGAKTELPACCALLPGGQHICNACSAGAVHLHLLPVPATPSRRWLPLPAATQQKVAAPGYSPQQEVASPVG